MANAKTCRLPRGFLAAGVGTFRVSVGDDLLRLTLAEYCLLAYFREIRGGRWAAPAGSRLGPA